MEMLDHDKQPKSRSERLNKLSSMDYDIECWQIVEAFNKRSSVGQESGARQQPT
jgi:hypothetical protein